MCEVCNSVNPNRKLEISFPGPSSPSSCVVLAHLPLPSQLLTASLPLGTRPKLSAFSLITNPSFEMQLFRSTLIPTILNLIAFVCSVQVLPLWRLFPPRSSVPATEHECSGIGRTDLPAVASGTSCLGQSRGG